MKQETKKSKMMIMPANSTGWFWHCLARETGRIGHLFSPNAQRGPFPWMPYALDNGAFSCWDMRENAFDINKWNALIDDWKRMLVWSGTHAQKPLWAIVPDVIGNCEATLEQWEQYANIVQNCEIPLAIAVQDGMTKEDVRSPTPKPTVIAIGGTTEWKWKTVQYWCRAFDHVHVLRCNSPDKLPYLSELGVKSCDGTGWNRGSRKQTAGLEEWCRQNATPNFQSLTPVTCRGRKKSEDKNQITFA